MTPTVPNFKEKFELTPDQFEAWASHLDPADLAEFTLIYGGDNYLLRFVCAIDYLTLQKVSFPHPDELFTTAYWIAAVAFEPQLDPGSATLRNRALRAWKSDAVQALYDRVRYRSVRQGSIRLQNKLFAIAETLADQAERADADFEQKIEATKALVNVVKLVDMQEAAVRAERTKRGFTAARAALERGNDMSERELTVMLKAAKTQLGEERFKALTSGAE